MRKIYLLAVVSILLVGCNIGTTNTTISGTITKTNSLVDGDWNAHLYYIFVIAGIDYEFHLSSPSGDTVGIWSSDAGDFILEVSPVVTERYTSYAFETTGIQEFWIETISDDMPSEYIFSIYD